MKTKLICIEGIPGSGKSSTAQYISRKLGELGYKHKWWYEEELGHPVYVYTDAASAMQTVTDLTGGNYRDVIRRALERWERFAELAAESDEIIIVDGCLLGYLTWSLFPNNVPEAEITDYVMEVERIIRILNPCLIYFYQDDLRAAMSKIIARRGSGAEKHMLERVSQSQYGISRGLAGFEGMVAYWQNYRVIMDRLYDLLQLPKLRIENHMGDWPAYYRRIHAFLGIEAGEDACDSMADLEKYAGSYSYTDSAGCDQVCSVQWEAGKLIVDGLPQVWTRTALLPNKNAIDFDVASLPFKIRFLLNPVYAHMQLHMTGPALLDGSGDCMAARINTG
ncbi:AAA family ATPase [Paenibacillus spongiae]|uniref:AAA family ATPase n=1 Tax=Paenibacillus spongiae TaxID=2909671 RepID=A0ABY5S6N8_9BACL|nr:AAA family ATPase [Paenibacillus spongiae]UVI28495.1 AAA family ATPase [Paenibacillus spongiae]